MVSSTYMIVSMKKTFLHRLKLCKFGVELRVTGSRNMASDIDQMIASTRRFLTWYTKSVKFYLQPLRDLFLEC